MEKKTSYKREGVEQHYKFSDDDIKKANSISIVDWAKEQGYPVEENRRWAEIKGQGGLTIDKMYNRWYCHSAEKGGGPIQLLMYLNNIKWNEAVGQLINENIMYKVITTSKEIIEPDKSQFELPEANDSYKHVFAYLINTRKIDKDIVSSFIKNKLIYENKMRSCVFVGRDKEGNPRFANIRSTNTYGIAFKGNTELSDKRYGFSKVGSNNVLTITEAPIDLLSYMTIFKKNNMMHIIENDHLHALGGLSNIALKQYLDDHPEINEIRLCLDSDKYGQKKSVRIFCDYYEKYYIKPVRFKNKDVNEILKNDGPDTVYDEMAILDSYKPLHLFEISENSVNSLFQIIKAKDNERNLLSEVLKNFGLYPLLEFMPSGYISEETYERIKKLSNIFNNRESALGDLEYLTSVSKQCYVQLLNQQKNIGYLIKNSSKIGLNDVQTANLTNFYQIAINYHSKMNQDIIKNIMIHEKNNIEITCETSNCNDLAMEP